MERALFYYEIRPHFNGVLKQETVTGIEALLNAGQAEGLSLEHMAYVLANVRKETASSMSPIKETVMPYHKDKNPSDAEVIRRLEAAYKKGQLPWVKKPYWKEGFFGRGYIQLTHDYNYLKFTPIVGEDIFNNPELAMKPDIAAMIAVVGMKKGLFTGKKLSNFTFPDDLTQPPKNNPRRIVNGADGTDEEVAKFYRQFAMALTIAKYGKTKPQQNWLSMLIQLFKRKA